MWKSLTLAIGLVLASGAAHSALAPAHNDAVRTQSASVSKSDGSYQEARRTHVRSHYRRTKSGYTRVRSHYRRR